MKVVTAALVTGFTFGIVLTASRTGAACLLLLTTWSWIDRRRPAFVCRLLGSLPLIYMVGWWTAERWSASHSQTFAGATQLHATDLSSSRFAIWSNTLDLMKQNPWTGVGLGEFNFAWTLTPFPNRPVAFFDHTHNLPLQLWVELGLPLGTLVLALLGWALWKAFINAKNAPPDQAPMYRTAFVMVLMMGVHSMLEYPLWYAYFLLPTAFAWGLCLADPNRPEPETTAAPTPAQRRWRTAFVSLSLLMCAGAIFSMWDYQRVVRIFVPPKDGTSLEQRIQDGMHSVFSAHHAHYAAATTALRPSEVMPSFAQATHYLLDARLMMAWAKALNESGDVERARYVAARLKEFRNPMSKEFFEVCDQPVGANEPTPFQCTPPTKAFTFRDFR
jgi:hypothetical protein